MWPAADEAAVDDAAVDETVVDEVALDKAAVAAAVEEAAGRPSRGPRQHDDAVTPVSGKKICRKSGLTGLLRRYGLC